jgi:hypothetical protein
VRRNRHMIDPVTLDVIQAGLRQVCDGSPIIEVTE